MQYSYGLTQLKCSRCYEVGQNFTNNKSKFNQNNYLQRTFSQQLTMPYCFAEIVLTHIHLYVLYKMKKGFPSLELHFKSMSM